MLAKYLRDNGELVGCVVAVGPNQIGVSICNPLDRFDKKRAKQIAVGRANVTESGLPSHIPNRYVIDGQIDINDDDGFYVPSIISMKELVEREVNIMKERANRYFKPSEIKTIEVN